MGDKAHIEANSIVAAKSGILTKARVRAGEPVWGIPARPLRQYLKNLALVAKLPAMRNELRDLKKRVEAPPSSE
jgi:UDP-3-O-[3-hydroxymyristoyl] glucosamine N-acyltransferase